MSADVSTPSEPYTPVMRLTLCKCGHEAVAHYDSHLFCTWTTAEPPECDCEKFEAAGPEVFVQIGKPNV